MHLTISFRNDIAVRYSVNIVELTIVPYITPGNDPTGTRAAGHSDVRIFTS